MRGSFVAALLVAAGVVAIACGAKVADPPVIEPPVEAGIGDGGGVVVEAGQAADAGCAVRGDTCMTSDRCCSLAGQAADLTRGCMAAGRISLVCKAPPRPGGACVGNTAEGCVTRRVDGGLEAFLTPSLWEGDELSGGFEACTPEVRQQVSDAQRNGTCK